MALRRMVLRDFLLVTALDLDFQAGLTVLSGETGAGKSILIDAMQLALGARGESGLVRDGAQRAEVVVEFDPPGAADAQFLDWLQEAGFEATDGLILRRVLDTQGKSRCWINGSVATVGQLYRAGQAMVDIHGQHAWQSLMRPHSARLLLDAYAGADAAPTEAAWQLWRAALERLTEAQGSLAQLQQERERLQWQIDEVAKLGPGQDEWHVLNTSHTRLAHAQDLQRAASDARELLDGSEDEGGALDALRRARALLAERLAIEPGFGPLETTLQQLVAPLEDVARSLREYAAATELDPDDLAQLDARLGAWLGLARRYRQAPEDLYGLWQQWQLQLQALDAGSDMDALRAAEQQAGDAYRDSATALSARRRQAAPGLAAAVNAQLQLLGMGGERFSVDVRPLAQPQAAGVDEVQFLLGGHGAGGARPLARVASGGELSRVSLAIAVCTSRLGETATLVFDEVDAGIGGAVAHSVGRLLQQLAGRSQVLAVTHLPQIAVCADQQFVVSRQEGAKEQHSRVALVENEERVAEIARMLGSQTPSAATLAHAREMLCESARERARMPARRPAPHPRRKKDA